MGRLVEAPTQNYPHRPTPRLRASPDAVTAAAP